MKAGRGGGGAGDARKWVRDGVERQGVWFTSLMSAVTMVFSRSCVGPVTEEPPIYPPNPSVESAPELDSAAANAVLTYRLLANHWRSSECAVLERESKLDGLHYGRSSSNSSSLLNAQKDAIMSYCGLDYFPAELMHNKLIRVSKAMNRAALESKRQRLKEMEQKEIENKGAEEKQQHPADANAEEDLFADEQEDFGGDDYAHDYYADEDADDNFDDGDDGGVL